MTADPTTTPDAPASLTQNSFEASLAPREGDLLSLPFDQYGRMRIVQNILHTLYSHLAPPPSDNGVSNFKLRVLDVGGYPGVLSHFLNEEHYEVSVLDVPPDDGTIPNYTQGSGMDLPFGDGSFDVVTSLDTLEHIPNNERPKFLSELMRVAGSAAVVVNPVQSVENDLAEETLNEFIRWILDAQQEQLAEHRECGLPSFDLTASTFEQAGWQTVRFPTANIYNWLLMMIAKHYLISMRDERASAFERTLDRFYNLTFSQTDRTEPAYRGVLVAARPGLEPALEKIRADYPPFPSSGASNTERLQLTQVLMGMLNLKIANHEDFLLREQMERRDKHIMGLETRINLNENEIERLRTEREMMLAEREAIKVELLNRDSYVARLDEEQRNKDEHILYLEKLLQGIEAGRVMRLTRTISRFLGR